MGKPMLPWTQADVDAGLCSPEDLENQDRVDLTPPIDPALPFNEKVRKGLEKYLDEVGYDQIWRDNPDAAVRAVVKVIVPPAPPVQVNQSFGLDADGNPINPFPWVTPERIRAMSQVEVAPDILAKSKSPRLPAPEGKTVFSSPDDGEPTKH